MRRFSVRLRVVAGRAALKLSCSFNRVCSESKQTSTFAGRAVYVKRTAVAAGWFNADKAQTPPYGGGVSGDCRLTFQANLTDNSNRQLDGAAAREKRTKSAPSLFIITDIRSILTREALFNGKKQV